MKTYILTTYVYPWYLLIHTFRLNLAKYFI